jgi:hypothetical protein
MTNKEEIAKLKQELAEQKAKVEALEAAQPKPAPAGSRLLTKEEQDAYQKEMDELRHRREREVPPWLVEACAGGVSDRDARAIAATARAPTGRPGVIPETVRPGGPSGRPAANVPGSGTRTRTDRKPLLSIRGWPDHSTVSP